MTEPDLVSIGVFAQAARVSVKALRHYHAVGLLEPAWVDPATRYRYYRWDQLSDVLCITTLRDLDVSLDGIRTHLVDGTPLREILAAEQSRLERQLARAARALAVVESLRGRSELPTDAVDEVTWEPRSVLRITGEAHADTLTADAVRLIERLLVRGQAGGADTDEPVIGRYPLTLRGSMRICALLPVAEAGRSGPNDRDANVADAVLAGGRLARVVHTGPHESLALAYHSLIRWLHAAGHPAEGPVFERYVDDPRTVPADRLRTEVLHLLPPQAANPD